MSATRIDRGSTDTTTIYSEGGDLVFERTFEAPREEVEGRTTVRSIGHMGSPEAIEGALAIGMVGGAIETWDRLADVLAER